MRPVQHFAYSKETILQPPLGGILFQAIRLQRKLKSLEVHSASPNSRRLSGILAEIASRIRNRLGLLHERRAGTPRHQVQDRNILGLCKLLYHVNECTEHIIHAGRSRRHEPTELFLKSLLDRYVVDILNLKDPKEYIIFITPSRGRSPRYDDLTKRMNMAAQPGVLFSQGEYSKSDIWEALKELENKGGRKSSSGFPTIGSPIWPYVPRVAGVLSYPDLDSHDFLMLPLLAHEVAHLIDLNFINRIPGQSTISDRQDWQIRRQALRAANKEFFEGRLEENNPSHELSAIADRLHERVTDLLRESVADVLATRMVGFPYFCSLAEILKSVTTWDLEHYVLKERDYPGARVRLSLVWEELRHSGVLEALVDWTNKSRFAQKNFVRDYFESWNSILGTVNLDDLRTSGMKISSAMTGTMRFQEDSLVLELFRSVWPKVSGLLRALVKNPPSFPLTDRLDQFLTGIAQSNIKPGMFARNRSFDSVAETLTTGCIFDIADVCSRPNPAEGHLAKDEQLFEQYRHTCDLLILCLGWQPNLD